MIEAIDDRDDVIAELRRRLSEAEETLSAIRQGEVDALVVRGQDSDEIFTIEGEAAYRSFMEAMDPGAVALDDNGRVLYATAKAATLLHRPLEEIQGHRLSDSLDSENAEKFEWLLSETAKRSLGTTTLVVKRAGASDQIIEVSAKPLRIGAISGLAATFTDATERVRAEAAEQNERAARAVIASANEAVLVCDRSGIVTHANAAAKVVYDGDIVGQRFSSAVPLVFPFATGLIQGDDIVESALGGNSVQGIEAVAPNAPTVRDYLVSVAPLRVAGETVSGCVITMVDLSQRKTAEKQQLLLMAELDHRVKNTLALVQSISSRTLSAEDSLQGYHTAFSGRLQALAATHNLLAKQSWSNLRVDDVLLAELAPYVEQGSSRLTVEGLDITVAPRAAIALGLILHELATNAVKYGALSNETGVVSVRAISRIDEGGPFVFEWRESGGPTVAPPERQGFGRTVITRSLQYSPHGRADLVFDPTGVICTVAIPPEDLASSAAAA